MGEDKSKKLNERGSEQKKEIRVVQSKRVISMN